MTSKRSPRIGIWPGSLPSNRFVETYAAALRDAGGHVVGVRRAYDADLCDIDIFHIHWPEEIMWQVGLVHFAWRASETITALRLMKSRGTKIVWMVHNLEPHELSAARRVIWSWYRRQLESLADGFMTLCPATLDDVRAYMPKLGEKPGAYIWHPWYELKACRDVRVVRDEIDVPPDGRLFALLGLIRRYKAIEELVDAFTKVHHRSDRLLIGGRPIDPAYADELRAAAKSDDRITLLFEDLSDERFDELLYAADVIVLPFAKYLHSGSLIHALSAKRPIITPETPFALALSEEVGVGWIQTYVGPLHACHLDRASTPGRPAPIAGLGSAPHWCQGHGILCRAHRRFTHVPCRLTSVCLTAVFAAPFHAQLGSSRFR